MVGFLGGLARGYAGVSSMLGKGLTNKALAGGVLRTGAVGAGIGGLIGGVRDDMTFMQGAGRGFLAGAAVGGAVGAHGMAKLGGWGGMNVSGAAQSVRAGAAEVMGRAGGYAARAGKSARRAASTVANNPRAQAAYAGAARTASNVAARARGARRSGGGFGPSSTPMLPPRSRAAHGPVIGSNRRKAVPMGTGRAARGSGVTRMPSNQGISQLHRLSHRKQALDTLGRLQTMMAPTGGLASNKGPAFHPGRAQLRRLTKKMNSNTAVQKTSSANSGKSFVDSLTNDAYGYGYLQNVRRRR